MKGSVTVRDIAEFLGRSPNTISHEIKTNSVKGVYEAEKAQLKMHQRRWRAKSQCLKVAMDSFLIRFVEERIQAPYRWNPKQVSGHLKLELGITCSGGGIRRKVGRSERRTR